MVAMKSILKDLLTDTVGTDFQKAVWGQLIKIPKGKTMTYKEIAILIGRPNSARAVANACGKNPMPVTIPCHRAIRSDGNIGGYSAPGGVKQKIKLLKMEKLNTI
jgi:methylated-DNA-[protein]-cysteine S-methyltransferase